MLQYERIAAKVHPSFVKPNYITGRIKRALEGLDMGEFKNAAHRRAGALPVLAVASSLTVM